MKVLVVLAHGSRVAKSNAEVISLAERLKVLVGGNYDHIEPCFLELTEPRLVDVLPQLVDLSATEIVVYPHFLAEGRHVRDDIPSIIKAFEIKHPNVKIQLLPYLGLWDGLTDLIASRL